MVEICGDYLEGGGQILRTSLALSAVLNKPVKIYNIRGKRPKPGLRPQHYTGFKIMAELCNAKVKGLSIGSCCVEFIPQGFYAKNLNIDIGTAGSIGLLLQTLILPLSIKSENVVSLRIRGGTHVPKAIPADYYKNVLVPIFSLMGVKLDIKILNQGYYPKGGGEVEVKIHPWRERRRIKLTHRKDVQKIAGIIHASKELSKNKVGERIRDKVEKILKEKYLLDLDVKYFDTLSCGCGIVLWAECYNTVLGADALGEKGKPAEKVAEEAVDKLLREINSQAGCDSHTGDNLIPWLAFCGGEITVSQLSLHTRTNIWVVEQFLGSIFECKNNLIAVKEN